MLVLVAYQTLSMMRLCFWKSVSSCITMLRMLTESQTRSASLQGQSCSDPTSTMKRQNTRVSWWCVVMKMPFSWVLLAELIYVSSIDIWYFYTTFTCLLPLKLCSFLLVLLRNSHFNGCDLDDMINVKYKNLVIYFVEHNKWHKIIDFYYFFNWNW